MPYLYHIGVGAPWQNGVCERGGSTIEEIVGAIVQSQSINTFPGMQEAVGEAVTAYNSDVNSSGVAVLNGFGNRHAEHSLISSRLPWRGKLPSVKLLGWQ